MRGYFCLTCGLGLACALAVLAGTAGAASPSKRATFRVTLEATVTKSWNTVVETTENGCPTSRRSVGVRTTVLRSSKPSIVVVTFRGANVVAYSPAVVRFVRTQVRVAGSRTTRVAAPCEVRTVHSACSPVRRTVSGGSARFFRSRRNEISFSPMRLPEVAAGCPGESARVRAIRPRLSAAQGEIAEASLANPRSRGQTGLASTEVETDLEGDETGTVVERVRWALTFTPVRSE
jgi:hypothetical protein